MKASRSGPECEFAEFELFEAFPLPIFQETYATIKA
jgi:hypothetical protein